MECDCDSNSFSSPVIIEDNQNNYVEDNEMGGSCSTNEGEEEGM
jgi:hypothetical protein